MADSDWLVIGVGNHLRQDDAVGPAIVEQLQDVKRLEHSGEGAGLIESWREHERVIIVDAAKSGAAPGTIHCFDAAHQRIPKGCFHYSSHQFSVAEAVEMARVLGQLPSTCWLFGVEGESFDFGEGLTDPVAAAMPEVVQQIRELIDG